LEIELLAELETLRGNKAAQDIDDLVPLFWF